MTRRRRPVLLIALLALAALLAVPAARRLPGRGTTAEGTAGAPSSAAMSAAAYDPVPRTMYELPSDQPCLKGRGNCAIYGKAAQMPSGRLVASLERSTVPASGSAKGQTLPVYTSEDDGRTWRPWSEVAAPAVLSHDKQYAPYTSTWTSPYLYVLPEDVGRLRAGTLLLAGVVSGDDAYFREHKAADPGWVPDNDGDRSNLAIALFASSDEGASWRVLGIVAKGGWQGGSAGAIGKNVARANTHRQVDPVWEPYLLAYHGRLVAYYSDENDYRGFDPRTGAAQLDPRNDTGPDSHGQVLVHRTWDGTSAAWSAPVLDVSGLATTGRDGTRVIGGGRPGMPNVVPTSDGRWLLTFEYWGGGPDVRYKTASSPLRFFAAGGAAGTGVDTLATAAGSQPLSQGGNPVAVRLPDGRLVYGAGGSADLWVSTTGRSDGPWTQFRTSVGAGYSRGLTYDSRTGRLVILRASWGDAAATSLVEHAEVDLGNSAGPYAMVVNRSTGQVIGTADHVNDAEIGNGGTPDVRLEKAGSAADPRTQQWHVVVKAGGAVTLLNRSGGRTATIWGGRVAAGARIGQQVDDTAVGLWTVVRAGKDQVRFRSVADPALYLTGASAGAPLTLETERGDGTQDWVLQPAR